ncbi:MAG: hypothetical protein K2W82_16660 [Candidatus Obscuribacterales bacterium]|nr:hypothetical protein [Candidatus Obscuribacterales bacterium]
MSNNMERFLAIAAENKAQQQRARDLNRRAGQELFPVLSREELKAWLSTRLNGAGSVAAVRDLESLCLPPLDPALVERVLHDNPDTIELLGESHPLEYRADGSAPRLNVKAAFLTGLQFEQLPDEGVKLPQGRLVAVYIRLDNWSGDIADTDMPALKEKCRRRVNDIAWRAAQASLPALVMPVVESDEALPAIVEFEYGQCAYTGVKLLAYGVVECYSWSRSFHGSWCLDRSQAEEVYEASVSRLAELREEVRRREVTSAQTAALNAAASAASAANQAKRDGHKETADALLAELLKVKALHKKQPALAASVTAITAQEKAYWDLNFNKSIAVIKWNEAAETLVVSSFYATAGNAAALKELLDGLSEKLLVQLEALPEDNNLNNALTLLTELELLLKQLSSKGNSEGLDLYNGGRKLRTLCQIVRG